MKLERRTHIAKINKGRIIISRRKMLISLHDATDEKINKPNNMRGIELSLISQFVAIPKRPILKVPTPTINSNHRDVCFLINEDREKQP
jgi:hypothetical protein